MAVAGALLFAACGEKQVPDPAAEIQKAGPKKPCDLVNKSEVEAAAGLAVAEALDGAGAPPPIPLVGMRFCMYRSATSGGPIVQIGYTSRFPEVVFEKAKTDPGLQPLTPVGGVGQEALWHPAGAISWLIALQPDAVVGVHLSFIEQDAEQIARDLAAKALRGV